MLKRFMLALLLLASLTSMYVWAEGNPGTVIIDPLAARIDLSDRLTLLRDPERRLSFSEVLTRQDQFEPARREDLVTSFNPGAFWLKTSLLNTSSGPQVRWIKAGTAKTQRVTVHLRQEEGWQILKSGRSVAVLEKPIATLSPVFPVTLLPGKAVDVLIHVDSGGATDMATQVWAPQAYHHAEGQDLMQRALLLGGLLISSTLALIVFIKLRETQYLWLGLLLIGVAGLEASRENLLGTYFWPEHLATPPQTLAFSALIVIFGMSKVVSHALELPQRMPRAAWLLFGLRWTAVVGALISPLSYGHGVRIMSAASVVHNIATLILSGQALRHNQLAARIFPAAFSLALLTETARQLANLGILPWIAAMEFSTHLFLLATPLILLGLVEQTRQLSEKLQMAEELQHAKSAFFARISHELRAPLNTILGYARMLARGSSRLSIGEGTQGIEKNSLRLLRLIDEVLDDARAAAGQLSTHPSPMSLQPWLEEIAKTSRISIEEHGNRFATDYAGPLNVVLKADGERLRQVINNLISNANRHTRQGEIRLRCHATLQDREIVLDFAVTDDGEGIDARRLPHLFEPFERGPTSSHGHGLGLSICRELTRQMGGEISVSSILGQGSEFSFSICCPLVLDERAPSRPNAKLCPTAGPVSDLHVLIVDDDPVQLDLLAEQLGHAGLQVCATTDGGAILRHLAEADWDLVITDQMMPGVDGWAVLKQARTHHPRLPVALISSVDPCRPADFPETLNFDAVLHKPCAFEDIASTAWYLILRRQDDAALLEADWASLARLADEGDLSGIEDWLAACRQACPNGEVILHFIERLSHQLDFPLIQSLAEGLHMRHAAHVQVA